MFKDEFLNEGGEKSILGAGGHFSQESVCSASIRTRVRSLEPRQRGKLDAMLHMWNPSAGGGAGAQRQRGLWCSLASWTTLQGEF